MIENICRSWARGRCSPRSGGGALLFGATAIFSELQGTLNTIWDAPSRRGWWYWVFLVVKRSVTFAALLVSGSGAVLDMGASTLLAAFPERPGAGAPRRRSCR